MKGFLYYLPGRTKGVAIADLEAVGLGYAFERTGAMGIAHRGVRGGPDGGEGMLVAAVAGGDRLIGYEAGKQTWRKIPALPDGQEVWVGFQTERPPGPADLIRHEVLMGGELELGDGRRWTVPIARGQGETEEGGLGWYHTLPQLVGVDEIGQWVLGEVLPRYQWLWKLAQGWADAWWQMYFPQPRSGDQESGDQDPGDQESDAVQLSMDRKLFDLAELGNAATAVLAANYRLGKAEVSMLGLFDGQEPMRKILGVLIDWPFVEEWFKKKAASLVESAPTEDGPPADTPATGPA